MYISSTDELMQALMQTEDYTDFQTVSEEHAPVLSMPEYLDTLLLEKNLSKAEVIRNAGLNTIYGYQIFQGSRQPSRDKLLQLAFGFPLTYEETAKLLRIAGTSGLYVKRKRDSIIIFALHKGLSLLELNTLLEQEGEGYLA